MTSAATADLERFRAIVSKRLGLVFDDAHLAHLEETLADGAAARQCTVGDYLRALETTGAGDPDLARVAARMTVGETYFFRGTDQLRAFAEAAIPDLMRARASSRRLRILSAGCASGEEAYTVAILLERIPDLQRWDVRILGIDVNPVALARARAARYTPWSLRETPAETAAACFAAAGSDRILAPRFRGLADFEERNLLGDDDGFWSPGSFDVIFCRNVTIYFSAETTRRLIARFARALSPGGYLFLGHAETLRGVSQEFHLRTTHDAFYYQLKDDRAAPEARRPADAVHPAVAESPLSASWFDDIGRSSERVASLTAPRPGGGPTEAQPSVGELQKLFRDERFDALDEHLRALAGDALSSPAVGLLQAALCANRGKLDEAERLCARVLERDELNAEAHYLAALCREAAGDAEGAVREARSAAHLDPRFAMPRLKLGHLAHRAGDSASARVHLSEALELLAGEDELRILLLAGGFTREMLLELCRSGLRASGPRP
jgi:chemotaxis protein methyltransferase CheR